MAVLLIGMLAGSALAATIAARLLRPCAPVIAGIVLLALAAAAIATAPAHQILRLAVPLLFEPDSTAGAVLSLLAILAAVGGGAFGWALREILPPAQPAPLPPGMAPPDPFAAAKRAAARARILRDAGIVALCLLLALTGAAFGHVSLPRALLIGLFAGISVVTSLDLREALYAGLPELRSSWGGLGGGLGGWELSRPAVLLLVALSFAGAALAAAVAPPPPPGPETKMNQPPNPEARKPPIGF